jgi:DNA-binding NarL/FixJ family response regulator
VSIVRSDESRSSVLIVEDHELLAQSLGMALRREGLDVEVSGLSSLEGVLAEARGQAPGAVLLDLDLGEPVGDGVALIAPLRAQGGRVLVVTGSRDLHRHGLCLEQGAVGVLPKSTSFEGLLEAVITVVNGGSPITDGHRQSLLAELRSWRSANARRLEPFEQLTPRERQVLGELMRGRSADAIATAWVVSEATVRTQIRGVLTKLGVTSQLAAVAAARAAGWTPAQEH